MIRNKPNTLKIKNMANYIVNILLNNGFVIQRYDAYSSSSVYLKLDYGVCNSIRISDHNGKENLCYRYNLIIGCDNNIIEDKYIRYYYNENSIDDLIMLILLDKKSKVNKYTQGRYNSFMRKNRDEHASDAQGFWSQAKLVTKQEANV